MQSIISEKAVAETENVEEDYWNFINNFVSNNLGRIALLIICAKVALDYV